MINGARGEVSAVLAGEERRLCLTLGALAEMETALGCEGAGELSARLRRLSAGDLAAVLSALLRGGGAEAQEADAIAARAGFGEAAAAVAAAFAAAGG